MIALSCHNYIELLQWDLYLRSPDLQELLSVAEMRGDVVAQSELLLLIEDFVVENTNLGWVAIFIVIMEVDI